MQGFSLRERGDRLSLLVHQGKERCWTHAYAVRGKTSEAYLSEVGIVCVMYPANVNGGLSPVRPLHRELPGSGLLA